MTKTTENVLIATAIAAVTSATTAIATTAASRKYLNKSVEKDKENIKMNEERLAQNIIKSEQLLGTLPDQVDKAVRFVYDNEAKSAFDRRLRSVNIEELAVNECQKTVKGIEDSVLRKYIRDTYSAQVRTTLSDEIRAYFKDGINKIVDNEIDSDFIRRTARNYVKDEINDIVEQEVEDAVDRCDIDAAIESYIDDNSNKFDTQIKKNITKILYEKFDDDFVDKVKSAIEGAVDDD